VIRFQRVAFAYREAEPVLTDVDLEIPAGLTLLVGPNGCGKSTLLKLAAGVEKPDAGAVEIGGHDLWTEEVAARRDLAYVPETPDLTPYATVAEIVALVCRLRGEPPAAAPRALETVGLSRVSGHSVRELSMGQRRRAVLACALVGAPRHVLLDEPLEAMDRAARDDILAWIDGLIARAATVVVVSHDLEPFGARAVRALTLREGRARVLDPLPADAEARRRALEAMARPGLGLP
jgi:ABC-type multidrug transport system ATPase subunit